MKSGNKKGRHKDAPAQTERAKKGKIWELYKAKIMGRGGFSPEKLAQTIATFKNGGISSTEISRPHKPSGKKPISRPK